MIRERTQAGLVATRARGRIGGRRPKLGPQQAEIVDMVQAGRRSQADAARLFRVHPATVSRLLAAHRQQAAPARPPADA
jgi:DNA invertase Pin-like site-specific DNA recombinase